MDQSDKYQEIVARTFQNWKKKSKCFDIFQDFKLNNYKMYEYKPARNLVLYKIKRSKLIKFLEKIRLLRGLLGYTVYGNCNLIEIMLKDIWLSKQIFILDIE